VFSMFETQCAIGFTTVLESETRLSQQEEITNGHVADVVQNKADEEARISG
jgi:hypothetical protein